MKCLVPLAIALSLSVGVSADPCPNVNFTLEQTLTGSYGGWVDHLQTIDYDHDGKLDLVGTIDEASGWASLYSWRGNGDGTFQAAVALNETQVMDLQVINVNNDAYLDLVGSNYYDVWVRLGNASGFNTPIYTYTNYPAYDIQLGNFNEGTGNIDLVVSSLVGSSSTSRFVVYEGNGDGTFTETRRVTTGTDNNWQTDVAVADFDNDGRYDVAVSRRMSEQVQVYFRNVDGTFASAVNLAAGVWPDQMKAGDFNEDGLADLVSVNWEDGTIEYFENNGSRAFAPSAVLDGSYPGDGGGLFSLHVVDINADSNLDILAGSVNGNWLTIYLGNGDGTFKSPTWFVNEDAISIATGNFDGDADLEVALGDWQVLYTADYVCTPQVVLYSKAPVISVGQTAKLRANVSGISESTPLPRGTVTFKEGATTLGISNVDTNGEAILDLTGLGVGDHVITAEFSGNSTVSAATSPSITQKVILETSSISLSIGSSTHGEPFNSIVYITNRYGSPDNGYYTLTLDGVTYTEPRWSGAALTLTLSAGAHTISAEFEGDTYDPPSTSPTYNFTTARHAVTLTKSGDTTVRVGTAHALQITVAATTSPTPTGTVELFRGSTSLGSASVSGGVATFNVTLPRGSYEYSATYWGDTNYLTGSTQFTLNVLANASVAIDALALESMVYIPAVVPNGTTSAVMYRRIHGTVPWSAVSSWSLASPYDDGTGMTRGVLYDYRLDATVSAVIQQSNVDSALLFTDPTLTANSTNVKLVHFAELRDSINALRTMAGLSPFAFDGTFGSGLAVRASHLAGLRTALNQARSTLGMVAATYTDAASAGVIIKKAHVTELRSASR